MLAGGRGTVASRPYIYSGQGFSLQRDKGRFVLPAQFRATLKASSEGMTVCLGKDEALDCIVGFGLSRKDEMVAKFDAEEAVALEKGLPFDAVQRGMSLFSVIDVPFDGSGRFILPESVSKPAKIGDQLYFHGAGRFFTAWNPEVLAKLGQGWEGAKAICESLQSAELAKVKRK